MLRELSVFGLAIKSYSLFAAIAALTGAAMAFKPLRQRGLKKRQIVLLYVCMLLAFLLGARLWNVAVNPAHYDASHPWYTLKMTGFSLYGGILGAGLVLLLFVRLVRASLPAVLDATVVPYACSFSLMRVGCFLNGCCYGKATELPWGVVFPGEQMDLLASIFHKDAYPVHPTQLYELLLALLGLPLCLLITKRLRCARGCLFALYAAWFSLLRLAILPLRTLPYSDAVQHTFYPVLYLSLAGLGILLFVFLQRKNRKRTGD